jgi:hypothetical protein
MGFRSRGNGTNDDQDDAERGSVGPSSAVVIKLATIDAHQPIEHWRRTSP